MSTRLAKTEASGTGLPFACERVQPKYPIALRDNLIEGMEFVVLDGGPGSPQDPNSPAITVDGFMKLPQETWPISSILLLLFGASLLAVGVYFLMLRPPLLPEDLRFLGASQAQLEAVAPRLASWLTNVFRVLGGFISATGILAIALAATSYRSHHRGAGAAAALAGSISIGLMTGVNFTIDSDFKWQLLGLATLWGCSILAFIAEKLGTGTSR